MKLPSDSGCSTSNGQNEHVPVAVAVRSTSQGSNNSSSATSPPAGSANGSSGTNPSRRKTAYQFSLRQLEGDHYIRLSEFKGKVLLIANVASHCNSTTKGYYQLNDLQEAFPDLAIVGCPCNQFGHQENLNGREILMSLKYVRPGNGFEPKFPLSEKVEVNGANAHPIFNFLKLSLPFPSDRTLFDEMSAPSGVFSHPMRITWMPVSRADVSWNFEKFLIGPDGVPFRRYSPKIDYETIAADIRTLMQSSDYAHNEGATLADAQQQAL